MKQTKTQNLQWHVGVWPSFLHSWKSITKTLSLFAYQNFLRVFNFSNNSLFLNIVLTFAKSQIVNTIFLFTTNQSMSSFKIDLNCDFSYQSVDCLFTTFKYYLPCITEIKGFVFQKTLSAIDFHRSFKFPVLTNLSSTKKRLLRKKFRTKRTFHKKVAPSPSGTAETHLFFKISSILILEKRQQFLQTVHDLSSSLQ